MGMVGARGACGVSTGRGCCRGSRGGPRPPAASRGVCLEGAGGCDTDAESFSKRGAVRQGSRFSFCFRTAHSPALSPFRSGHGQGSQAEPGQAGPEEAAQQQPVPVSAMAWWGAVGGGMEVVGAPLPLPALPPSNPSACPWLWMLTWRHRMSLPCPHGHLPNPNPNPNPPDRGSEASSAQEKRRSLWSPRGCSLGF